MLTNITRQHLLHDTLVRAGTLDFSEVEVPLFTVASQENYLKEDILLRTVAGSLERIRGEELMYDIEKLQHDNPPIFFL